MAHNPIVYHDDHEYPPESLGDGGNLNEKYTGSQELNMTNNECPDVVEPQEDKQEHSVLKERDPLPLLGVVAAQIQKSQDPCGQLSPLEQEKTPSEIKERIITSASASNVAPPLCQKVVTASPQDDPSARKRCLDKARCDAAAGATPTTGSVGQGENGMLERDKDTDSQPAELQDEDMGTPEAEEVLRQADSSALGLPPPDQAGLLVAKDIPATKEKQNKDEEDMDRRDAAAGAAPAEEGHAHGGERDGLVVVAAAHRAHRTLGAAHATRLQGRATADASQDLARRAGVRLGRGAQGGAPQQE